MQLTQRLSNSILGILLLLSTIAGLLNFPITCQCGAPLPHEHSLFMVNQHRHQVEARQQVSQSVPDVARRVPSDDHQHDHQHHQHHRTNSGVARATTVDQEQQADQSPFASEFSRSDLRTPSAPSYTGELVAATLNVPLVPAAGNIDSWSMDQERMLSGEPPLPESPPPRG